MEVTHETKKTLLNIATLYINQEMVCLDNRQTWVEPLEPVLGPRTKEKKFIKQKKNNPGNQADFVLNHWNINCSPDRNWKQNWDRAQPGELTPTLEKRCWRKTFYAPFMKQDQPEKINWPKKVNWIKAAQWADVLNKPHIRAYALKRVEDKAVPVDTGFYTPSTAFCQEALDHNLNLEDNNLIQLVTYPSYWNKIKAAPHTTNPISREIVKVLQGRTDISYCNLEQGLERLNTNVEDTWIWQQLAKKINQLLEGSGTGAESIARKLLYQLVEIPRCETWLNETLSPKLVEVGGKHGIHSRNAAVLSILSKHGMSPQNIIAHNEQPKDAKELTQRLKESIERIPTKELPGLANWPTLMRERLGRREPIDTQTAETIIESENYTTEEGQTAWELCSLRNKIRQEALARHKWGRTIIINSKQHCGYNLLKKLWDKNIPVKEWLEICTSSNNKTSIETGLQIVQWSGTRPGKDEAIKELIEKGGKDQTGILGELLKTDKELYQRLTPTQQLKAWIENPELPEPENFKLKKGELENHINSALRYENIRAILWLAKQASAREYQNKLLRGAAEHGGKSGVEKLLQTQPTWKEAEIPWCRNKDTVHALILGGIKPNLPAHKDNLVEHVLVHELPGHLTASDKTKLTTRELTEGENSRLLHRLIPSQSSWNPYLQGIYQNGSLNLPKVRGEGWNPEMPITTQFKNRLTKISNENKTKRPLDWSIEWETGENRWKKIARQPAPKKSLERELPLGYNHQEFLHILGALCAEAKMGKNNTHRLEQQAFSLQILCGTFTEALKLVRRHHKWREGTRPWHDAGLFELPRDGRWTRNAWKDLINFHSGRGTELLANADRIEQLLGRPPKNLQEANEAMTELYTGNTSNENVELVKLLMQYHRTPAQIREYATVLNQKTLAKNLPDINTPVDGKKGWRLRRLDPADPRGCALGLILRNCQHLHGQGKDCAWHGTTQANGAFYVLENDHGIQAGCWAWRHKNTVVIDSWEERNENEPTNAALFSHFGKLLLKMGITEVRLGTGGRTPGNLPFKKAQRPCPPPTGPDQQPCYTDAKIQWVIIRQSKTPLKGGQADTCRMGGLGTVLHGDEKEQQTEKQTESIPPEHAGSGGGKP